MDIKDVFKTPFQTPQSITGVVTSFLDIAFVVAGVILLFFFVLGGIGMISSAGSDNAQQMEQSKKTLTSALIGFIIIFAAYWIVQLLGRVAGVTILTP